MAMSQSESRRAAMKAFEESLSHLQNTLQSEAPSENSLPNHGYASQPNQPAVQPSAPAKPAASRSPQFTLEDLEEAAQDIENYMRCRTQDC